LKSTRKVLYVELEFSTSDNLLVKKLKLEIREDSLPYFLNYKNAPTDKIEIGAFFLIQ
jgi:hypothetical protein